MRRDGHGSPPEAESELRLIQAAQREARQLADAESHAGSSRSPGLAFERLESALSGYRVTRRLGTGGQGVVFEAVEDSSQLPVAIKVMRDGPFSSGSERVRFEREMQILAQLNHPNIVTIRDRGTVNGSSFYVMDYVAGPSLHERISSPDEALKDKLRLFVDICRAIHAAHLQGVIHRDLKPGNIRLDLDGDPHILDFGLAKLTADAVDLDAQSMTQTGQFVGSTPWASPEQACGKSNIDIRTDVYSLGIILYQLLTHGRFPYPVVGRLRDVLESIISTDPQRPSTLNHDVDDELETIVLKCLAKEPDRRYQSAGDLARDVQRYLGGEAIEAKRDSYWYQLRKLAIRRKFPATIGALIVLFLIGLSGAMYVGKRNAELRTEEQDVLTEVFTLLDPDKAPSAAVLDDYVARLEKLSFSDQRIEAKVWGMVGNFYRDRADYAKAEAQLRKALTLRTAIYGEEHLDTAQTQEDLANVLWFAGRYAEALPLYEKTLATRTDLVGPDSAEAAVSLNALAATHDKLGDHETAEAHYRRVMDIRSRLYDPQHELMAATKNNLATCLIEQGELAEAEGLLREAVETMRKLQGDSHPHVAKGLHTLGRLAFAQGRDDEAERLLLDAIDRKQRRLGPEHDSVAASLIVLAEIKLQHGDFAECTPPAREAVSILDKTFPEGQRRCDQARVVLGRCLTGLGEYEEAEETLLAAFNHLRSLPATTPIHKADLALAADSLIALYDETNRANEAATYRPFVTP
jgi:tetratricopeptide (TPR) repeat protein/predicted Ser/Thr protein kinase